MNVKELRELQNKEFEKIERLQKQYSNKKDFNIRNYYPEYFKQGTFIEPLVSANENLNVLLPYYGTIIVTLSPIKSEKVFKEKYGLSVEDYLKLEKEGKLRTRLSTYIDFSRLDYLDPILNLEPPTYFRSQFYWVDLRGRKKSQQYFTEFDTLYDALLPNAKNEIIEYYNLRPGKSNYSIPVTTENFIYNAWLSEYVVLKAFANDNVIQMVENDFYDKPLTTRIQTHILSQFVVNPILFACDGIKLIPEKTFGFIHNLPLTKSLVESFPEDVGKLLIDKFNLLHVKNMLFDQTIEFYKDNHKARTALFEFDNAVSNMQLEKAIDRKTALEKTWKEANEITNSMKLRKNQLMRWIPVKLGIVGALFGSIESFPGIITGFLGGSIASLPIVEPLADRIVKTHKQNHIVACFDLEESK